MDLQNPINNHDQVQQRQLLDNKGSPIDCVFKIEEYFQGFKGEWYAKPNSNFNIVGDVVVVLPEYKIEGYTKGYHIFDMAHIQYQDGTTYDGTIYKLQPHGPGMIKEYENQFTWKGEFLNGLKHGVGNEIHENDQQVVVYQKDEEVFRMREQEMSFQQKKQVHDLGELLRKDLNNFNESFHFPCLQKLYDQLKSFSKDINEDFIKKSKKLKEEFDKEFTLLFQQFQQKHEPKLTDAQLKQMKLEEERLLKVKQQQEEELRKQREEQERRKRVQQRKNELEKKMFDKIKSTVVNLNAQKITDNDIELLQDDFNSGKFNSLTGLYVDSNQITDTGILQLCSAFKLGKCSSLLAFHASNNQITDNGVKYIAEVFSKGQFQVLNELVLFNNKIGDNGSQYLIDQIKKSKKIELTFLNLANNKLSKQKQKDIILQFNNIKQGTIQIRL